MSVETELKAAWQAWKTAQKTGDTAAERVAGDAYQKQLEEVGDEACVYRGEIWYEHDYDETECRRCGAEAPYDDEED